MKNIYVLCLFFLFFSNGFAQNSAETNITGSTPIFRSSGFGSVPQITSFTNKASILGHTGSTSTTSATIGVLGYSANSETANYGVYGYATGLLSSNNMGIYGHANVNVGNGFGVRGITTSNSSNADALYGGSFLTVVNANVNPSAVCYGMISQAGGAGAITTAYGAFSNSTANVSMASYGILAESASTGGTGNETGGYFSARGISTGSLKIGIQAKSSGTALTQIRYGVQSIVDGPASTNAYGIHSLADNSGNGATYGGYFKAQGTGTGSKFGIYATTAGSGSQYAAAFIGKVGINTEVPSDALTVYTTTGNQGLTHTDGTISVSTYVGVNAGWLGTKSNHPLYFYTNNGNQQVTLLQNGNLGVGISPTEKLHVSGNILASGNINANNITASTTLNAQNITATGNVNAAYGVISNSFNVGGQLNTDALNVGNGGAIFKIKKTVITGQQIFGVVNNTCDLQYYTVNGVEVGDVILLNIDNPFSTLTVANVKASNTNQIEVKFCNIGTSNTILQTGHTFRVISYR